MRKITTRYDGECGKCQAELPIGTEIMYEKRTGVFCIGCQPTEVEEIRTYRQEKADRKADRIDEWADKAEARGNALCNESRDMASVIPMGQPILVGHHSEKRDRRYRERIGNKMDRSIEESKKAERHRDRAAGLRHVVVKGDAERKRQAYRDEMDKRITKGSRVQDACFGTGTVVGVYKKSYRIEWDRLKDGTSRAFSRDKSYVTPLKEEVTA